MKIKFRKAFSNDNKIHFKNELAAGTLGFLSVIYIIPLTISLYKSAGVNNFPIFLTLILTMFFTNIMGGLIIKKPAIIGPSIAVSILLTKTMINEMNYTIGNLIAPLMLSSVFLLLLNYKKIGFKIISGIPSYLKQFLGVSMGLYLIYIGFNQAGISIVVNGEIGFSSFINKKTLLVLLGLAIIFFGYFKKNNYTMLVSIIVLSLIIIIGIYSFDWKMNKIVNYGSMFRNDDFSWENYKYDIGTGFLEPTSYVFSILITILIIIGIPSMIRPINKSMNQVDENLEDKYTDRLFTTISMGSTVNSFTTCGFPSLFAETMVMTHSKGRTGFSNMVFSLWMLIAIALFPIIPILSNNIVTAPSIIFIGYISARSCINDLSTKPKEIFVGIFTIVVTLFTNSIPHGLAAAFILNLLTNIFSREKAYINIYTIALAFILIFYEVMIELIHYNII